MHRNTLPSVLALMAIAPSMAQTTSTTTQAAASPSSLPPVVISASRSGEAQPVDLVGASVTVIDDRAMEQRQTRVVSDVLRDVPGVAVSRTGAIGGLTQLRLRGTEGNHVLVLIDGIEASDPYYGEYDFGTLIADEGSRIEVLRGQQSALYGSDAIGGVIQYITLSGAEAPGLRARAEAGSFGTAGGSIRYAGLAGPLDYALSATAYHTDGRPTARDGSRKVGSDSAATSAKLSWAVAPNLKLSAVGRYSYTDADTNNSDNDTTSPTFGYTIDSPGVHYRNEAVYGLVKAEHTSFDGRFVNALSLQVADTERKGYDESGFDYGDQGKRTKASFVSSLRLGDRALAHRVTVAVDKERESFKNTTPSEFAFQGRRSTENLGLVGEYEMVVDEKLALGGSVRNDNNNRFADATTYRVQASYRIVPATRVHAAYGTGVKNPGYFELYGYSDGRYIGNPDLKPEKSKGWEAGVLQTLPGDRGTFGVTYFDSKLTDEIYTTYPPPDFIATPGNRTTQSTQRGLEFALHARLHPQIDVDAAYTWLKAREDGVEEVRRPKSIASVNLTGRSADRLWSGTLTVRYNGRQSDVAYTDPSFVPVRVALGSYTLVNLGGEYRLSDTVSLFARVENILDKRYEEVFSFATTGRAGYAGVRASF